MYYILYRTRGKDCPPATDGADVCRLCGDGDTVVNCCYRYYFRLTAVHWRYVGRRCSRPTAVSTMSSSIIVGDTASLFLVHVTLQRRWRQHHPAQVAVRKHGMSVASFCPD